MSLIQHLLDHRVMKADDGVLANDPGNIARIESLSQPTRVALTLQPVGTFLYRPNSSATAGQIDTFSYRAFDAAGDASSDTVVTLRISNGIASPHQNPISRHDANADGSIDPTDVLTGINSLIRYGL